MNTQITLKHFAPLLLALSLHTACTGVGQQSNNGSDSTAAVKPDTMTIAVTGDIMMGNTFPSDRLPPDDGAHIFDEVKEVLRSADVACGNLEGTIATSGQPRKNMNSKMAFMFMMPPRYAQYLVDAGYDYVGLANNHIYDFWEEAMTQTEENLTKVGMGFSGAKDPNGKHAHQESYSKEINGKKYGFCAFGHEDYSLRTQDTATVRRIVTELKRTCDIVIVCFHGGAEGSGAKHLPYETEFFCGDDRGRLREFTHFAIDCGADVVYGHGPHVVRAVELYHDRFIAYSLGNFCTCGMGVYGETGYAPVITVRIDQDGKFIDGKIHAFLQQHMRGPKADPTFTVVKEIAMLTNADIKDSKLNISPEGIITRK